MNKSTATKQAVNKRDERGRFAVGNVPSTGFHTNPERRGNGSWKKADTPRFKLEQMMTLTKEELLGIISDESLPLFEQKLANAILDGSWVVMRDMINEVYGRPKESVDINETRDDCIIRGFVIPKIDTANIIELSES
jgi:hypothetical protein